MLICKLEIKISATRNLNDKELDFISEEVQEALEAIDFREIILQKLKETKANVQDLKIIVEG